MQFCLSNINIEIHCPAEDKQVYESVEDKLTLMSQLLQRQQTPDLLIWTNIIYQQNLQSTSFQI